MSSDIFSLIPDYWNVHERGKDVIALTHVCQAWRKTFISRPSLWTNVNCVDPDKIRVYFERSKGSSICLQIGRRWDPCPSGPLSQAISQVVSHATGRFKSVRIEDVTGNLQNIVAHLSRPAPLLEHLAIANCLHYQLGDNVTLAALFNGDLSSLRTLTLWSIRTELPWKNMVNLSSFKLTYPPPEGTSIKQFVDFFQSAPRLCEIDLRHAIPTSGVEVGRLVSLECLKRMEIFGGGPCSLLLDHLLIPTGAYLSVGMCWNGDRLEGHFPRDLKNLRNLSGCTEIHLTLSKANPSIYFIGPNGNIRVSSEAREDDITPQVLEYLARFSTSRIERLELHYDNSPRGDLLFWALKPMENLRTFKISRSKLASTIIRALDPHLNAGQIACPNLKRIALDPHAGLDKFDVVGVIKLALRRASKGAKLEAIRITNRGICFETYVLNSSGHSLRMEYDREVGMMWR